MRTILTIYDHIQMADTVNSAANSIATAMTFTVSSIMNNDLQNIDRITEETDAAMLIIGTSEKKSIQFYLTSLRTLRIPYIFIKPEQTFSPAEIVLPVTNLEEEKEKGPFASSFARFFKAEITIYKPDDYGTKAQTNIDAMTNLFESFALQYNVVKGKKNSFGVELEAAKASANSGNRIIIISASREYGLDDLIFGPKERKIIKTAQIPVVVINPRSDLYALCD